MDRVRKRDHEMHRQRISQMRPQIDTTVPSVYHLDHLRNNLKREQILEERYFEIDRENKILLQKMSDIMKTAGSSERGKSGPPSLNRDGRKNELMRITQENQAILKRIQQAQPVYNHVAWEDSYKKSANYLKNSAEYPIVLSKRQTSRVTLAPLKSSSGFDQAPGGVCQPGQEGHNEEELRYVLKEGRKIGETYFLVEMATDGRTLVISAFDGDQRRTRELIVNEKNHRRLYREANGDYNIIAEKLYLDGDQLRLLSVDGGTSSPGQEGSPNP